MCIKSEFSVHPRIKNPLSTMHNFNCNDNIGHSVTLIFIK